LFSANILDFGTDKAAMDTRSVDTVIAEVTRIVSERQMAG
jgi:hypothetical protein